MEDERQLRTVLKEESDKSDEITKRLRRKGYIAVGPVMTKEAATDFITGLAANDPDNCYIVCSLDCKYIPVRVLE